MSTLNVRSAGHQKLVYKRLEKIAVSKMFNVAQINLILGSAEEEIKKETADFVRFHYIKLPLPSYETLLPKLEKLEEKESLTYKISLAELVFFNPPLSWRASSLLRRKEIQIGTLGCKNEIGMFPVLKLDFLGSYQLGFYEELAFHRRSVILLLKEIDTQARREMHLARVQNRFPGNHIIRHRA